MPVPIRPTVLAANFTPRRAFPVVIVSGALLGHWTKSKALHRDQMGKIRVRLPMKM